MSPKGKKKKKSREISRHNTIFFFLVFEIVCGSLATGVCTINWSFM